MDPGDLPPLPDDPRIIRYPWDREITGSHLEGFLERCDATHPVPLDFALLLDGNLEFARAAKAIGLRSIIGTGPAGKPFTRSFPRPADAEGWRELAVKLVLTKKARKE